MKHLITLIISFIGWYNPCHASGITNFQLHEQNSDALNLDGRVVVNTTTKTGSVPKTFYGADTNGFIPLPSSSMVAPLRLNYIKFGGNLHSVYNWKLNKYLDPVHGILTVYAPLDTRVQWIKNLYSATPMFQVNMLGIQPDYDDHGRLTMMQTATATHAANAIKMLNRQSSTRVYNILMGNEPFQSQEVHGVPIPSADEYIEKYIHYAVALRDAQASIGGKASDLKLWGPELATGWTNWQTTHPDDCVLNYELPGGYSCSYGNGRFTEFIPYFLYRLAAFEKDRNLNPKGYKLLDYLTWHYYPFFRTNFSNPDSIIADEKGRQNVAGMLESVNLWTSPNYINQFDNASPKNIAPQIVPKFKAWRNAYYPNAKIAVTEFGIDSTKNINYHPIVRPLYLADLMSRLGECGVDVFVNSFLQGIDINDQWGMINSVDKKPVYWVYSLISGSYVGNVVPVTDSYGDKVNAYAVKTETGTNIILVNKDVVAHTPSINITKISGKRTISDLTLPAWSVTVVTIPDREGKINIKQYGAKEMGIAIPTYFGTH